MLELVELELQKKYGRKDIDFLLVKKRAIMKATAARWKAFVSKKQREALPQRSITDLSISNSGKVNILLQLY